MSKGKHLLTKDYLTNIEAGCHFFPIDFIIIMILKLQLKNHIGFRSTAQAAGNHRPLPDRCSEES